MQVTPVTPDCSSPRSPSWSRPARPGAARGRRRRPDPSAGAGRRGRRRAARPRPGDGRGRRGRLPAPRVAAAGVRAHGPGRVPRRLARRRRRCAARCSTRPAPDGSGRVLPRLWDAAADRAHRDGYVELPADGVVVLAGGLLLGRGLPLDAGRAPADERRSAGPPATGGRALDAARRTPATTSGEHAREMRTWWCWRTTRTGRRCGDREMSHRVGEEGVEPSRPYGHTDLNRARLPFRHSPWRRES